MKASLSMQVHPIQTPMANAYLIETSQGLLLIDAGPRFAPKRILQAITALGHTPQDLKMILITHADADHTGGLAALAKATGAPIGASETAARAIEKGISSRPINLPGWLLWLMNPMLTSTPLQIDRILKPGDMVLDVLEVLDTHGHTPGHLSFYAADEKVLFSGDSVLRHGELLEPSKGVFCWDEAQAKQAADRQLALDPEHIYSGHSIWHKAD